MNKLELSKLLTIASLVDNRTVTPETVEAWHAAIGHLGYNDSVDALNVHRRDSTEYLQPAHITAGVRLITARRARDNRINQQAIEQRSITLDRAEFERLTALYTEQARKEKANGGR